MRVYTWQQATPTQRERIRTTIRSMTRERDGENGPDMLREFEKQLEEIGKLSLDLQSLYQFFFWEDGSNSIVEIFGFVPNDREIMTFLVSQGYISSLEDTLGCLAFHWIREGAGLGILGNIGHVLDHVNAWIAQHKQGGFVAVFPSEQKATLYTELYGFIRTELARQFVGKQKPILITRLPVHFPTTVA